MLEDEVKKAIEKYPKAVAEYKNGKTAMIGLFAGEVMKNTRGTADPKQVVAMVKEEPLTMEEI